MFVSAAALLLGALLAWRQSAVRRLRWGPLLIGWTVLLGLGLMSLTWSANRYSTVLWVTQWGMAGLAFRLAYTVAGEKMGHEWVVRSYLLSAAVFGMVAMWMYLTSDYPRLTGTFYWPNPAAAYLVPAIMVGVDRLRRAVGRSSWWWSIATLWFLVVFLLTDSRAATMVLAVCLLIYLALIKLKRTFWIKLLFVMILAFGLSTGIGKLSIITAHHTSSTVSGSRFVEVAKGEPTSLHDRLDYLESAVSIWAAQPLVGSGAGTFRDVHPRHQQNVVSASTSVHNVYVQTLAELGIVGAGALGLVLMSLFSGTLRGLKERPEMLAVALGVFGLMLHFGLDIDTDYPALLILAAVLVGLVYEQWWPARSRLKLLWPAVAATALVPTVSLYLSDGWAVRAAAAQNDGNYVLAAADYNAAHRGPVYNPDYVNAEGIDWYTMASAGGASAKADSSRALDLARQAEVLDPHDGQHHQLEGRVLALRGDYQGAEAAFRFALKLDPYDHPEYALDLAGVQAVAGDLNGAVATAQAMLQLYPPAVVANRNMDDTIRPTLANLQALIGNIDLARGDLKGADVAAKAAIYWDPTSLRGQALRNQVRKLTSK